MVPAVGTPLVPVRIRLKHRGTLSKHGYVHTSAMKAADRRAALASAVREFGATYVLRKLNVLVIYNRYRHPAQAAVFEADKRWLQGLARQSKKGFTRTLKTP